MAVYRQIADSLREEITSGDFGPGDRLPSEKKLTARFDVARMTVRQALSELIAEGLLVARHGKGVFVRERPFVRRVASDRFARRHREEGKGAFIAETEEIGEPAVDELEVGFEAPASDVKEALSLKSRQQVLARRRRYLIDGQPVELADSYVPASIARGTAIAELDTGPGGIYARLEELGHELAEFVELVSGRMPTPVERRRLQLPAGTPVLIVRRTAFDKAGRAVEFTDTIKAAPSFELVYRIPAV